MQNEERFHNKLAVINMQDQTLDDTLEKIKKAKIVAILRAKDADLAIQRYD